MYPGLVGLYDKYEKLDGDDFRLFRNSLGMTAEHLAATLRVSRQTVFALENDGQCSPHLRIFAGVTLHELSLANAKANLLIESRLRSL